MTYGQSCRALSCNAAQGLVCNSQSICGCPSTNSYWSYNEGGCRKLTVDVSDGETFFIYLQVVVQIVGLQSKANVFLYRHLL